MGNSHQFFLVFLVFNYLPFVSKLLFLPFLFTSQFFLHFFSSFFFFFLLSILFLKWEFYVIFLGFIYLNVYLLSQSFSLSPVSIYLSLNFFPLFSQQFFRVSFSIFQFFLVLWRFSAAMILFFSQHFVQLKPRSWCSWVSVTVFGRKCHLLTVSFLQILMRFSLKFGLSFHLGFFSSYFVVMLALVTVIFVLDYCLGLDLSISQVVLVHRLSSFFPYFSLLGIDLFFLLLTVSEVQEGIVQQLSSLST